MLRWLGEDGLPKFHSVPPWRAPGGGGPSAPLPLPECLVWAGRIGVPPAAVREWYERGDRAPSRVTYAPGRSLDDMLGGASG